MAIFLNSKPVKKINLEKIDLSDRNFKISRNRTDKVLYDSIREYGILDPPVLLIEKKKLKIIFGHNRINYAMEMGTKHINAVVLDKLIPVDYVNYSLLKCFRNEIGPAGKIKLLSIFRDYCNITDERLLEIGITGFNIPQIIMVNHIDRINSLPLNLKDYLDSRDINFKIINDLLTLPGDAINTVSKWIDYAYMRVNIFKSIISMMSDIIQRDGSINKIESIKLKEEDDRRKMEEYIFNALYNIRYPEYSSLKDKADEIKSFLSGDGIIIDYPDYFQGSAVKLSVNLEKDDNISKIKEKINGLDENKIFELLKLI